MMEQTLNNAKLVLFNHIQTIFLNNLSLKANNAYTLHVKTHAHTHQLNTATINN